jgi:hypothetical protein
VGAFLRVEEREGMVEMSRVTESIRVVDIRVEELHMGYYAGIMIMVKVQDGHDAGFRSLHSCIEGGSM